MRSFISQTLSGLTGRSYKSTLVVRSEGTGLASGAVFEPKALPNMCLAYRREVTSAPEFPSSAFRGTSPPFPKIKQVCKRDPRSMDTHQPHHLAPGLFSQQMKLIIEQGG